jgi:urease accessory protein
MNSPVASTNKTDLPQVGERLKTASLTQSRCARAALEFKVDPRGKTFLGRQRAEHPFHLTRPFVLEGDPDGMITLYLQSSSGGLYRGDDLTMNVELNSRAQVHLTTQASTIVHHTRGGEAKQSLVLSLATGSYCEYIPDSTILFSGASFYSRIRANLSPGARLLLADSFSWHDPQLTAASTCGGEPDLVFTRYHSDIEIYDSGGNALVLDRLRLDGETVLAKNCGIHDRYKAQGSLILIQPDSHEPILHALRELLCEFPGSYAGASVLPQSCGILIRFLAEDGVVLRRLITQCWIVLRQILFSGMPSIRRK